MIVLPAWFAPSAATPRLLDFGGFLEPGLGGRVQRINRMGSRFAVSITVPPLVVADYGRVLVSRLIRAKSQGIRIDYPLLDTDQSGLGIPHVDGSGQAGSTIALRDLTPGGLVKEGFWITISTAARGYLYNAAGDTTVGSDGRATVPISPMLRESPADGDAVIIPIPTIEGFVMGDELAWEMAIERVLSLSFEIQEVA